MLNICLISGRRNYTLLSKHSQILNHQNESYGIDKTSLKYDKESFRHESTPSSNTSCDEQISIDQSYQNELSTQNPVIYTIYGFQHSALRTYLFHILSILLLGIPYFIVKWFKTAFQLKYRQCDLGVCDVVFSKYRITIHKQNLN